MCAESAYRLRDGVQVRQEKFGLLFYDYRGPKLHFLPSGDLIGETFFLGKQTATELAESIRAERGGSPGSTMRFVTRVLDMLRSKGLIHEQPVY
ncbi:MAG: mycofactocin biosynthesis chaperone MftB [Thermodesulfobacteriota bacterium]